jgi:hypothetical protein
MKVLCGDPRDMMSMNTMTISLVVAEKTTNPIERFNIVRPEIKRLLADAGLPVQDIELNWPQVPAE